MKLTAEEYIDEVNGHNSWQHYPPSKQKVIGWLKQFAEMQVEAIEVIPCCTELKDKEVLSFEEFIENNFTEKDGMYQWNTTGNRDNWFTKDYVREAYNW